jgi:hypothetical protein
VVQVRCRQTPVSGLPQPTGAYALGRRAFDTRSPLIALLEGIAISALALGPSPEASTSRG